MARRVVASMVAVVVTGVLATVAFAQDGSQSEQRKTVRTALNGYENNLTPFTITFATGRPDDLVMLVYDSLYWSQVSQDPEPWLAESATASEDFRTWTVKLRPNVEWHDGRPLTAEDVKFTFDYFKNTAAPGRWTHHVTDVPTYTSGEVVDERTVRLEFEDPAPTFEILPAADLPILPKHIWEDIDNPESATDDPPIGSGPYKLTEIVPDQRYRFEANERYFKGKPLVDVLEMPIVPDPNAAFQALQTGQVDHVAQEVPPQVAERFESADDIEVTRGNDFDSTELRFNTRKAPLDDPQLRKAISLAIDYEELVEQVLQGDGEPGDDNWIHPQSPWSLPDGDHEFDPERAARMLDEAGYRRGDQGLRMTPDGEPLEFEVLVSSFDPESLRGLQLAAAQVEERLGIRLQPEALDPATIRQRTTPGPEGPPQHDAQMGTFDWHAHTDPDTLYFFFHSPGEKGIGAIFTAYSNPRFDQLVERATGMTAQERKPVLYEAQRILAEEVPLLTFWYRQNVIAYRPAAYDGWVGDSGHSLLTKRSFLEPYAQTGAAQGPAAAVGDDGDGNTLWIVLVVAAVLIALAIVGVVMMRRRRSETEGFE